MEPPRANAAVLLVAAEAGALRTRYSVSLLRAFRMARSTWGELQVN
jgi:hypothetical protein